MKRMAGPDAGFTIHFSDILPKNIEITDMSGLIITDVCDIIGTIKCKVDCIVDLSDVSSYKYTAGDFNDVPAVVTEIKFDRHYGFVTKYYVDWDDEKVCCMKQYGEIIEEYPIEDKDRMIQECRYRNIEYYKTQEGLDDIKDEIENFLLGYSKSSFVYGGGYMHSTYDGQFASIEEEYFTGYITDEKIIKFIDEAVQGNNIVTKYWVGTEENIIDCESREEAKQIAEEEGGQPFAHDYWVDIDGHYNKIHFYRL